MKRKTLLLIEINKFIDSFLVLAVNSEAGESKSHPNFVVQIEFDMHTTIMIILYSIFYNIYLWKRQLSFSNFRFLKKCWNYHMITFIIDLSN